MKTPGQVLYDTFRDHYAALNPAETLQMWFEVPGDMKQSYEEAAKGCMALVPPKEIVPKLYIDATPMEIRYEPDQTRRGFEATIKVWLPEIEANHARPGSTAESIAAIVNTVGGGGKIRLVPMSSPEIQAELSRLNRDGTVREFEENEATW